MGKVNEIEGMINDIHEAVTLASDVPIFTTEINKSTDLVFAVRPFCFDIILGNDLVYSCNIRENALTIYNVIRADLKGNVYHGNQSKT